MQLLILSLLCFHITASRHIPLNQDITESLAHVAQLNLTNHHVLGPMLKKIKNSWYKTVRKHLEAPGAVHMKKPDLAFRQLERQKMSVFKSKQTPRLFFNQFRTSIGNGINYRFIVRKQKRLRFTEN